MQKCIQFIQLLKYRINESNTVHLETVSVFVVLLSKFTIVNVMPMFQFLCSQLIKPDLFLSFFTRFYEFQLSENDESVEVLNVSRY